MTDFERMVKRSKPERVTELTAGRTGALKATYRGGVQAVIKIAKDSLPNGRRKQRGLPITAQPRHEAAYYQLAKMFGYEHLVPETHMIRFDGVPASAQKFVSAVRLVDLDPDLKDSSAPEWPKLVAKTCRVVPMSFWRQLLVLDITAGSRDRHSNNIGLQLRIEDQKPAYRLVAWDNAASFGKTFAKYHNVFHKFLFRKAVPFEDGLSAMGSIRHVDMNAELSGFLHQDEIDHAYLRMRFFLDYPYRLPWKVCSQGHDDSNDFPDYAGYFEGADEHAPLAQSA